MEISGGLKESESLKDAGEEEGYVEDLSESVAPCGSDSVLPPMDIQEEDQEIQGDEVDFPHPDLYRNLNLYSSEKSVGDESYHDLGWLELGQEAQETRETRHNLPFVGAFVNQILGFDDDDKEILRERLISTLNYHRAWE